MKAMKAMNVAIKPARSRASQRDGLIEDRIGYQGEIALIRIDVARSTANRLDAEMLRVLERKMRDLEANHFINGIVITGNDRGAFCAGPDHELLKEAVRDEERLEEYLALGQGAFEKIASMEMPVVAAIHGPCLSAGCELALACDFRIASPDPETQIGLPETRLGIVPALGGSTRLPRLIGVPAALDLITNGTILSAQQALAAGVVDQVVPRESLLKVAMGIINEHLLDVPRRSPLWRGWLNRATVSTLGKQMEEEIDRKARHYPAIRAAAQVVVKGSRESVKQSLERERVAACELSRDPTCRNLLDLFLLRERARAETREAAQRVAPIRCVGVVGAGMIGSGIAQWLSEQGLRVVLYDLDAHLLARGMERISRTYREAVRRERLTAARARAGLDRIFPVVSESSLAKADWMIEAVPEQRSTKETLFRKMNATLQAGAIFSTNTCSMPVSQIGAATSNAATSNAATSNAATSNAAKGEGGEREGDHRRLIGLRFFYPVYRMPLVEVILPEGDAGERSPEGAKGATGSDSLRDRALAFLHQVGKVPLFVRDSPGFLVNRVLAPYLIEAVAAFDAGASEEEIDEAMVDFGMIGGPLRVLDHVGLDVALNVAEVLAQAFPDRMKIPPLLRKMVAAGLLGKKVGHGFYTVPGTQVVAAWGVNHFRTFNGGAPEIPALRERLLLTIINEAAHCLEEGVVATAGEVDLGIVLGAGFPAFRGGPLRYADTLADSLANTPGGVTLPERMEEIGLKPCGSLRQMAAQGRRFYEGS